MPLSLLVSRLNSPSSQPLLTCELLLPSGSPRSLLEPNPRESSWVSSVVLVEGLELTVVIFYFNAVLAE